MISLLPLPRTFCLVLVAALPLGLPAAAQRPARPAPASAASYDPSVYTDGRRTSAALKALRWRNIGPFRGGRSVAVAGDPQKPLVFYFGAVNGGVWKTTSAGNRWENITDGRTDISSVGAIAVAPSDPNVLWVGTGEGQPREDLTYGTGVYRSTDGGATWQSLGLAETHQITAIKVDPNDADRAYVAALGHAFGPNPERGVFRTTDGGKSWKKVLFLDDSTGVADLALDPNNPRILFASMWKFQRTPWSMNAGGGRSGLWRSVDGGDTWTELTWAPGMPKGPLGKIGIAISPANSRRIYTSVEARDSLGGIFRSDDGGNTWARMNGEQKFAIRPWYYSQVTADPADENVVYVMNLQVQRSIDGGRTFRTMRVPHGDTHQLWIDPKHPERMINGNDGGGTVSLDGGATWSSIDNQPTAQFYHVTTDRRFPYRIYAAQQDNSTVSIASRSDDGAITERDWWPVAGCENAYIAVDPRDPAITYGGCYMGALGRYDERTHQSRDISVGLRNYDGWAAGDVPHRFQWTFPVLLSPHDPQTLYVTSQHVWRSRNEGQSWEKISPDLTKHDPATLGRSGGPVTGDMTGTEWYATIFAFAESPKVKGVLWAGSDDGLVHLSRDNGASWTNVTPKGLGPFTRISIIEPSHFEAGTAYLAANRYQQDDRRPYLFKTTDYGATWQSISAGMPEGAYTRAIREDVVKPGLLFAGTETGVYVSFDDGARWEPLQLNLPRASVRDLHVHDHDLIAGTHGRSIWVLDDIALLRTIADSVTTKPAHLFAPSAAIRFAGGGGRRASAVGENPPAGLILDYWLKVRPASAITLRILDATGTEVRRYTSESADATDSTGHPAADSAARVTRARQSVDSLAYRPADSTMTTRAGTNRFVWNLRYPAARTIPGAILDEGYPEGPVAMPGTYAIQLLVGTDTLRRTATLLPDPRLTATPDDYRAQFTTASEIITRITALTAAVAKVEDLQRQVGERSSQGADLPSATRLTSAATALRAKLEGVRTDISETTTKADQATLNYPVKLYQQLLTINAQVQDADARPTDQAVAVFRALSQQLDGHLNRLQVIEDTDLAAFNRLLQELGLPTVFVPAKKPVL